jgi:hypothetical protein
VEDDDVAHVRIAQPSRHAIDEHALPDLQSRHHRLARDAVRLDEKRLDPEREPKRHHDDQDQLEQRAGR